MMSIREILLLCLYKYYKEVIMEILDEYPLYCGEEKHIKAFS